jgi:uncharacterized protein
MIFVDTGIWYARFVPDDPNHLRVRAWLESNSTPLLTSDYCVDETLTLIAARKRPDLALVAGRHLFNETMARLLFLNNGQIYRAWILFQQRAAVGWSFTDCTSKIVIDDLGLASAATLDKHFQQFGVTILP